MRHRIERLEKLIGSPGLLQLAVQERAAQAEKEKQEIGESCNRLIKNCIICWNFLYLSQKLARAETKERKDRLLAAIITHSVVSWAHINLLGEYDFSDEKLQDSVGILPPKEVT